MAALRFGSARIFATLREPGHMNVMLDEPGILTAVAEHPSVCSEVYWGKRLAAASVSLARADRGLLAELLADAWEGKAPPRLTGPGPAARLPTVDP